MKTILITRPKEQAVNLAAYLETHGFRTVLFPTIEIVPVPHELPPVPKYAAIFFTSANGVTHFLEPMLLKKPHALALLRQIPLYVVGKRTADALHQYDLAGESLPDTFSAAALAAALTPEQVAGKRFLIIAGNLSQHLLAEHIVTLGGACDECVVYETRKPEPAASSDIAAQLASGDIDCVAFTSPSTATNFFELLNLTALPERVRVAAIGDTTAKALKELGITPDIVPPEPMGEALGRAIAAYYAASQFVA